MRKALKIILPLILILVLLVSAYWFFFQYRKDLPASLFAKFGGNAAESEDYETAIRWFKRANDLDPGSTEIALKLASAYEKDGNYAKTEYVLRNAIKASPDCIELYVALSKAYIAQDKLMDAQLLLDNILDESVLAALSARRPAAPTLKPESGYYSTYISVTLEPGDSAGCYLTVGDGFPSVVTDRYAGPVELPAGVSKVRAVAVSDEGLVSPEVYGEYTITGVIEEAVFADPAFESFIQTLLNRGQRSLRTDDLWNVTELVLPEDLSSIEDLRYFTGLTTLSMRNCFDSDFSFLSSMTSLRRLDLSGCALTSDQLKTVCQSCPQLEELRLSGCGLSNISPLSALKELLVLDLSDNSINNIVPLADCTQLKELYLSQNALTSLSSLSKLTELRTLDVAHNMLKSISPLSACKSMETLDVSYNNLTDVSAIGSMPLLQILHATNNEIEDVSKLSVCTQLRIFYMGDNKLTSIDFMNGFSKIQEINIDYNDVEAVPALPSDCALVIFSAAHNFLEDLSGLSGLQALNYVNADYNNIRDIDVLESCPNLVQVNVFGTYIDDGGVLAARGVVVNFTPSVS